MGRKAINIEKIRNENVRVQAWVQRRRGLLKKAIELAVLCDKEVYIVIADKKTEEFLEYSSSANFGHDGVGKLKALPEFARYDKSHFKNSSLDELKIKSRAIPCKRPSTNSLTQT